MSKQFAVIGMGRVGADHVVQPEREFGEFLARQMLSPGMKDYLKLGHDEALIEIEAPREWIGKSLAGLQLHHKRGLMVPAVKGEGQEGSLPRPEVPLKEGDMLVIGGPKKEIDKLDPSAV